jgi:hypothetical protein
MMVTCLVDVKGVDEAVLQTTGESVPARVVIKTDDGS